MERLTKRCADGKAYLCGRGIYNYEQVVDRLAAYEDAEEAGLLIRLPCKVGDTVYTESNIKGLISSFPAPDETWIFENRAAFGKTVFLTREEVEAALAREG